MSGGQEGERGKEREKERCHEHIDLYVVYKIFPPLYLINLAEKIFDICKAATHGRVEVPV